MPKKPGPYTDWAKIATDNGFLSEESMWSILYIVHGKSPREIQDMNGIYPSANTYRSRLKELGYPVRLRGGWNNRPIENSMRARIERLPGHENMTAHEIAAKTGLTVKQVWDNCSKFGIPFRRVKVSKRWGKGDEDG